MSLHPDVLVRLAFTVDGWAVSWGEVVQAAERSGEWGRLRRAAAAGLAALDAQQVDDELIAAAGTDFRMQRRLLSADEMAEWLEHWRLTIDEWRACLARSIAAHADRQLAAAVAGERIDAAVGPEAICSGELRRLSERLARRLAAAAAQGYELPLPSPGAEELAYTTFRARAAGDVAIEPAIVRNALRWTRITCRQLRHHSEDVVREALCCAREQRRGLAAAAVRAGTPATESVVWLADVTPELEKCLRAAHSGDLVGPLRDGASTIAVEVIARSPPQRADPDVRARAAVEAAELAVLRELQSRVVWHDHP